MKAAAISEATSAAARDWHLCNDRKPLVTSLRQGRNESGAVERDLVDHEGVGRGLGEARETVAAGQPAAEDVEVEGWSGGGEGDLAEEERRRRCGGGGGDGDGDGAHEDLVAEHGEIGRAHV